MFELRTMVHVSSRVPNMHAFVLSIFSSIFPFLPFCRLLASMLHDTISAGVEISKKELVFRVSEKGTAIVLSIFIP